MAAEVQRRPLSQQRLEGDEREAMQIPGPQSEQQVQSPEARLASESLEWLVHRESAEKAAGVETSHSGRR